MSGKLLLIYICIFHVLSHLLLIYICKLHWNSKVWNANSSTTDFWTTWSLENIITTTTLWSRHCILLSASTSLTCMPFTRRAWSQGKFLLIYIWNFHVLIHLPLIYICKLHWNLNTMKACNHTAWHIAI